VNSDQFPPFPALHTGENSGLLATVCLVSRQSGAFSHPGPPPSASWKDNAEHWRWIEHWRSVGELNDATYISIKKLLPITYADAVAIAKKANEEKRGASAEEIHDVLRVLESQHGEELPHAPTSTEMESDIDGFVMKAQATLLRWRLVKGYDWAFVRGALARLSRMARKEMAALNKLSAKRLEKMILWTGDDALRSRDLIHQTLSIGLLPIDSTPSLATASAARAKPQVMV
jgi:hypothetical protein